LASGRKEKMEKFKVLPQAINAYTIDPGHSDWTAFIPIFVNGQSHGLGQVGPGIKVMAPTQLELDELFDWVIEKLMS